MTALTPHIRVLRAEAAMFADVSRKTKTVSVAHMLMAIAEVKARTADDLEDEERALYEKAMRK